MALARVTVWNAGDVLTAAAQNGEFNNILDNALSLISPLTGNHMGVAPNAYLHGLEALGTTATAANESRIYYQTAEDQVHVDDGAAIRRVPTISGVIRGDVIYASANNQFARLAVGAADRVLTSDGTDVAWVAPVAAATQAQMETATSTTTYVSPGRTQYHPGVAKVWGEWDNAGTINVSYNLTSITDTGVGDHTAVVGTDFSSANWSAQATGGSANSVVNIASKAAGTANIIGRDLSTDPPSPAAAIDLSVWNFVGFGDQA